MKRVFCSILLMLSWFPVFAQETCPEVRSISRVPGEYAWVSTDGRWEGYFASPRTGRGTSNAVLGFAQARWIQLTDLLESPGVVECDYVGNSPGEVIRFVSSASNATTRSKNLNWTCQSDPEVPTLICICSGDTLNCPL